MQTVRCLHQKKCFSVTKMNTLPIPNELRVISKYTFNQNYYYLVISFNINC